MPAIFISHSSRDNQLAREIKDWLASQNFEGVFLDFDKDTGIGAGRHWERELYEAIERCQAMIVLITTAWLASKWCFAELTNAKAQGKAIFPIVETADYRKLIGPELQHIQLSIWDADGQQGLRRRLFEIADELARGHRFDPRRPPWPGIMSYEAADAAVFFGRDPEVRRVVEILEARRTQGGSRVVLITGSSGSGKSSLLKAGILPLLNRDDQAWIVLPPFRPGVSPLVSLAKMLASTEADGTDWSGIRDWLSGSGCHQALLDYLERRQVGGTREATALICIDQLEELWTLAGPSDRANFIRFVRVATDRTHRLPLLLIATVRSDFISELLAAELGWGHDPYTLPPMPMDRLSMVIQGPARVAGISLEGGLCARILQDVRSSEALPLLAFTLRELNDNFGADKRLEIVEYEALGSEAANLTPLENAVRRKAEEVLSTEGASSAEMEALREAFVVHLTRINDEGSRVRRPAAWGSIPSLAHSLVERLVGARLLTARGIDENRIVEVAHEALFRTWPQLSNWLDEEQDFLFGRRQIEQAERVWQAAPWEQKRDALLHGYLLDNARRWYARDPARLGDVREFVDASLRRRRAIRRRAVVAGLAAAAAVGVAGTMGANILSELSTYRRAREEEASRDDLNGTLMAYSTSPGNVVMDGAGETSPFVEALLPRLADETLSVTQVLSGAVNKTGEITLGRQRPEFTTNINGDIFIHNPPAKRRSAVLCIGINAYDNLPNLQNPMHDATYVATFFRNLNYSVTLLANPITSEVRNACRELTPEYSTELHVNASGHVQRALPEVRLAGLCIGSEQECSHGGAGGIDVPASPEHNTVPASPENDTVPTSPENNTVVFFFFFGHGLTYKGQTYVCARDAKIEKGADVISQCIPLGEIENELSRIAAVRVIIFDTSRSSAGLT